MSVFKGNNSTRKIRILYLDHAPFMGGAQAVLINHLRHIDKTRFEIFVGCGEGAGNKGMIRECDKLKIKYYIIPFSKFRTINPLLVINIAKTVNKIRKIIKTEEIDIICSNTVRTAVLSVFSVLFTRTKLVWIMHDFTFPRLIFKILQKFTFKNVFVSHSLVKYYNAPLGLKNILIYNGTDIYKRVKNINSEAINAKRKSWGLSENSFAVGYIGRLVESKGPQILIKAFEKIISAGIKDIKCIIIGSGRGQKENIELLLKEMVVYMRLENYVIFEGYLDDISISLVSLDLLCATTLTNEGFGLTAVEAMMAKVPVVVSRTSGYNEIINHQATGFLVTPGNVDELCDAIKILAKEKGERRLIAKQAYDYAMENFTIENMVKNYENLFTKAMAG